MTFYSNLRRRNSSKMSEDKGAQTGPTNSSSQTRLTMGPVVLHYNLQEMLRRPTRAQMVALGAPTVMGNDSTSDKEPLPGQWTLVEETNMESREPQKVWRKATRKATENLSEILKSSLIDYPHPMLSKDALSHLEAMRQNQLKK